MKPFAQYLAESEKTYNYRIKIVGDIDSEFEKEFKDQLKKFDPVSIKDTKKTPIISRPADFPDASNEAVNIIDVEFRYPAVFSQIQQAAKLLGLDVNRICMNTLNWAEGMDQELLGIESQPDSLLLAGYPADSKEQKDASRDYAAIGADKAVVRNSAGGAKWTVAGGTTPPAVTTNQLPQGVDSPMTKIKRPAKPTVGRPTKD
jgi:hypothetical protein